MIIVLTFTCNSSMEVRWFEPLDKKLYSTLSLFTQVNKWVQAIIMLEGGGGGGGRGVNRAMD